MDMGIDLSLVLDVMGTVWTENPLFLTPDFSISGSDATDGSGYGLGNFFDILGILIPYPSRPNTRCSQLLRKNS
jgi:hypothetical protein